MGSLGLLLTLLAYANKFCFMQFYYYYIGHLGHFLMHQVDLIYELIYLDVTWVINRSHVHM